MIHNGIQTIAAAGTPVSLTGGISTPCSWYILKPDPANTGNIYWGSPTSGDAVAAKGIPLAIGDSDVGWPLGNAQPYDLKFIFVDADTNGNKVRFAYGRN